MERFTLAEVDLMEKKNKNLTNSLNSLTELWETPGDVEQKEAEAPTKNTGLEKQVLKKRALKGLEEQQNRVKE